MCFAALASAAGARQQQIARLSGDNPPASKPAAAGAGAERGALKRIASLRGGETLEGWRVVVTSDSSLDDYAARREGSRFVVRLPRADASGVSNSVGGAIAGARVEQRGADVLLSFALPEGMAARVRQSFNRLEVLFSRQDAAQQQPPAKPTPTPVAPENRQGDPSNTVPNAPATSDPPTVREAVGAAKTVASGGGRNAVKLPPEKAQPVRIARLDKAPVIDGKLDDEVWKQAAVFKDFYQTEPGDNIAPSKPTEVFMGYDARYLYIAFHAYDDPTQVRARIAKRDQIGDDDTVGVLLDTFNDQRKAYQLEFNPLGIQSDAIYSEGSGDDPSFDLVMESKGTLTSDGYAVEVAIPFKSLRYEAGKGKAWGVHVFREIKRLNDETDSWMPLSRDVSGTLIQAGKITGLEGISTERTLEIIPSLTVSETGRRARAFAPVVIGQAPPALPGRLLNEPVAFDVGVTTKYTLTPTVSLDFAFNPDFAQVEADATVVTANQRFPIFFSEKRPFFLEGKEIFETSNSVVHTRAIVDPDYAVKLTGKRGRNSFGVILASDNAPGNFSDDELDERRLGVLSIPDPEVRRREELKFQTFTERFVGKNAYVGVFRVKRDVGKESSVGAFATTYNFIERHNHVAGIDGRFKIDAKTVAGFEVVGTNSRSFFRNPDLDYTLTHPADHPTSPGEPVYPGQNIFRTGNGFAYSWVWDYTGRHFGYVFNGSGRTRDYRAEVGFTRQTNTNNALAGWRWNTEPNPKAALTKFTIRNFTDTYWTWQSNLQSWSNGTNFEFSLAHQTFVQLGTNLGYERIFEEEFGPRRGPARPTGKLIEGAFAGLDGERQVRRKTVFIYAERQFTKQVYANLFVGTQRGIFDFDFGAGSRFPRVSPAQLGVEARRAQLRAAGFDEEDILNAVPDARLDPGAANGFDVNAGVNYKPTNALNLSLDYTKARLTRRDTGLLAFDENIYQLRATYQFTRFLFARARVDYETLDANARGQFLLGWTPNPGTAFYAGYNDDMTRNGFNRFSGQLEPGFRRNGRTFFVKMSYLFRRSFE